MKIQIKEIKIKEVEVVFPCYRKYKTDSTYQRFIKIISEDSCMSVDKDEIKTYEYVLDSFLSDVYESANKSEFDNLFNVAINNFKKLI